MKFSLTLNGYNPLLGISFADRGFYKTEDQTVMVDNFFWISLFGLRFTIYVEAK